MTDSNFIMLSRDQRDEILKAVKAIERQLNEIEAKPRWQVLYVIGTNLTIIQQPDQQVACRFELNALARQRAS
jgi:hypothetical protein